MVYGVAKLVLPLDHTFFISQSDVWSLSSPRGKFYCSDQCDGSNANSCNGHCGDAYVGNCHCDDISTYFGVSMHLKELSFWCSGANKDRP